MPIEYARFPRFLLATALLLAPSLAHAQQSPTFAYEKPPEKPAEAAEWKVQSKGGLLLTGGNSQAVNGVIGITGSHQSGDNKVSLDAGAAYGQSRILVPELDTNGDITGYSRRKEVSTNQWNLRARYDRFLTTNNALYALGQIGADRIAGKKLFGGGQLGYSRQLLKDEQHTLVAEIGYDFSFETYRSQPGVSNDAVTIHSGRLFVGELFSLTKETGITGSIEALFNLNKENALDASDRTGATDHVKAFNDTRVLGKVGLTTTLWKDLSFGFGFTLKYDQNPAPRPIPSSAGGAKYAPGFQAFADKIDTLTEATLILTLL